MRGRPIRPNGRRALLGFATLALLVAAGGARGDEGMELILTLEPSVVSVDETATLTLEARSTGFSRFQLEPDFTLDNLVVLSGPHSSRQFNWANGQTSRSVTYTWRVQPQEVGTASVSGVSVVVRGKVYTLPERTIAVQSEPTGRARQPSPSLSPLEEFLSGGARRQRGRAQPAPDVFLRAVASPADPYVGQQVTYTVYLYSQTDITGVEPEQVPDFRGLWVHDVPQPAELRSEVVEWDGQRYGRVPLMRKVLFPLRAEAIELEPAGFRLLARIPERGLFAPLMSSEAIRRRSNSVTVTPRPLPPAPPGHTGAVGRLELSAKLTPAAIDQGEAATLVVTLSGDGHIQGLQAPGLPELEAIRIYPPQQTSHSEVVRNRLRGERTWSYVLIPERAGDWTIPSIEVDFFDPQADEYRRAAADELRLSVAPAAPPVARLEEPAPRPEEIAPNEDSRWRQLLGWRPVAIAALSILMLILGAALWRRIRSGAGSDSERRLRDSLQQLPEDDPPRRIAAAIESAWRDYLAERWQIGPGQPSTQWSRLLEDQGANPDVASELVALADDLHYLRYAPQLSSVEELRGELVRRSLRLARSLR